MGDMLTEKGLAPGDRIEPRACGECLFFHPDKRDPDGQGWGWCIARRSSVTRKMHVVLTKDQPSCFQGYSSEGLSGRRLTLSMRVAVMVAVGATVVAIAYAVEFLTR